MSEIRIATDYLRNAERRAVVLKAEFENYSTLRSCDLSSAPEVARAFQDFNGRWDQRRGELATALDAISSALATIRTTFEKADADLKQQLEAGDGNVA